MTEHIILLHGLWMRGFSMLALRARLLRAGYAVHGFEYASVVEPPPRTLARLRRRIAALTASRASADVHLVGHSLGGMLALQCAREAGGTLPPGRIVCLGTPLTGSAAARAFAGRPFGQFLFGYSAAELVDGVSAWRGGREVGVIAGSLSHGLGAHLAHFEDENDGTVAVAETRLPGISDHCVVAASHTGLLFSAEAAEQTVAFLRDGRFEKH
ncbi:MAG: alpha/beta fold hydrolase [Proteobacteria bacterium]|nr:alpha/beta fold hydrolase [Pseudomonadota bacterium]